jgi:signal transduction histidine kinase
MHLFKTLSCIFWACLLCIASANAENLVIEQAFWEDKSGAADFSQAREQHYTAYQGVLNNGYTDSATWLRLRISHQTSNPQDRHIVLRVQPNYLDEVALYDPLEPRIKPRLVGDRTSYADQEYKSLSFGFLLPIGHEDRDVWLRVKSANLHLIHADAFGEMAIQLEEKNYLFKVVVIFGLMLFIFVFSLFNWAWNRDWIYKIFILRTSHFLVFLLIYMGVGRAYSEDGLDPAWLDSAFNLCVLSSTLLTCYFEFTVLKEYGYKRWPRWLRSLIYLGVFLAFLLYFVGMKAQALAVNYLLGAVMVLAFLCISLWGLEKRFALTAEGELGIDKRYFIVYYAFIFFTNPIFNQWLFILLEMPSKVFGMLPSYYPLSSSICMTFIFHFRAYNIRKNHQQLRINMALTNERMANERLRLEEQSNLLSMLMHEVRNPLAVIEVAQSHANAGSEELVLKSVNIIRSVLDRTLTLQKVSDGQLQIEKTTFLFSDCLLQALDDVGADKRRVALSGLSDEYISTDYACLLTILINLLGNALKYSPPDDVVQLEVTQSSLPHCFTFVVSNRIGACGQPDADRVFEKYYRGEGAKKLSGTGVGLYLVQQLAQRMGGTCQYVADAESVRFAVSLPLSSSYSS